MDKKIEQLLLSLPEDKRPIALEVRELMLNSSKEITESLKWGQLTFSLGKTNLAFIYTYNSTPYMNLGFMQAVELSDPKGLFEGSGKGMRHIKLYPEQKIPVTQIKKWIKEAVALAKK